MGESGKERRLMSTKIAVSSGKGGTGKTFVATNITAICAEKGKKVRYLDCDVEAPNGHLFLKPQIEEEEEVMILSPVGVDEAKCISCSDCAEACHYNAIAVIKEKVLFFQELLQVLQDFLLNKLHLSPLNIPYVLKSINKLI